ncbi:MAG: hypothetical protein IIC75_00860 [Bacteroidetes bacterium]|nr:hypothetical protein [Bacteroidota bacterium]
MKKNIIRAAYIFITPILGIVGDQISSKLELPSIFIILLFLVFIISLFLLELKLTPVDYFDSIPNKTIKANKKNKVGIIKKNMIFIDTYPLPFAIFFGIIIGTIIFYLVYNSKIGNAQQFFLNIDGTTVERHFFLIFNSWVIYNYEFVSFLLAALIIISYYFYFHPSNVSLFSIGLGIGLSIPIVLLDPFHEVLLTFLFTPILLLGISLLIQINKNKWWLAILAILLFGIPIVLIYTVQNQLINISVNAIDSNDQFETDIITLYTNGQQKIFYKLPFERNPQLKVYFKIYSLFELPKSSLKILTQNKSYFEIDVRGSNYPIDIIYEALAKREK